ncbi:hypothetical protein TNCV_105231 [Trichonephila clavipes]|nr:hypothetical protein TNCV_105231 [Trichonephila clavipes]
MTSLSSSKYNDLNRQATLSEWTKTAPLKESSIPNQLTLGEKRYLKLRPEVFWQASHLQLSPLDGRAYLTFVQQVLLELLDPSHVLPSLRLSMWYQHDRAPPHYEIHVHRYLNVPFSPVHWLVISPDHHAWTRHPLLQLKTSSLEYL